MQPGREQSELYLNSYLYPFHGRPNLMCSFHYFQPLILTEAVKAKVSSTNPFQFLSLLEYSLRGYLFTIW